MLKSIIDRPVTATVVSVILVILGLLGLSKLPLETFPEIAPPSVNVSARYPGASAEAVARSVATPLEQAINGVEGMTYMTSTSSNDGTLNISVFFKLGTNPDQAAVNVQNRVSQATSQLPPDVLKYGIATSKQQNSMIMVFDMYTYGKKYDATFVNNYMLINILPYIQRIQGVGKAQVFGSKDYAMRIWLDPSKLTAHNLSPQDVLNAINSQNLEAAPGKLGEGSSASYEYTIKYKGKLNRENDYENIIIKGNGDGSMLRLKDVARIALGSLDDAYATAQAINGDPGLGLAIYQTPGSNANDIQTQVLEFLKQARKKFPKGIDYKITYSTKRFLDASIEQVVHTLIEAFILVFLVVYLFLQDFRSTLIPAIAVPVSIIGTFFVMGLLGFTINLLTLFALVLAIGIVVDDAIVVVEAVHTHMEHEGIQARAATIMAMSEITGAIFSITLVMSAVFLPVSLIEGPVGVFYRQFAFTLAIAILLSAATALTLTPALCAILLKRPEHATGQQKGFFYRFNKGFDNFTGVYITLVVTLVRRKCIPVVGLLVITAATYWMSIRTPKGFIPTEDQSIVLTAVNMPPGTSLDQTKKYTRQVGAVLQRFDALFYNSMSNGSNVLTNSVSSSSATSYAVLKQPEERGSVKKLPEILDSIRRIFNRFPGASTLTFTLPTVQGFSTVDALDVVLQDNNAGSLNAFAQVKDQFIQELSKRKEIGGAFSTFNAGFPQLSLDVDAEKTKQLGLETSDVLATMQAYYGGVYASDFNRFGKYYRVVVQADIPYRMDEHSLQSIYTKNDAGKMVPLSAVVSLRHDHGPEIVSHLNQVNSIDLSVQAKAGYSTGDAMTAVDEVAAKVLPSGFGHQYIGMAKEEQAAGKQTVFVFALCLLFVYFLLCSQYESYILPLAVMCSIPTGVFGVFLLINLVGIENNIYVQIGLIMLIGLLAKNAILIVEFALQRRKAGLPLADAAIQAAKLRLRPILMTSLAFITGLLPLLFSSGASEQGNRSVATGAIGGMLSGIILGLIVTPVLFIIFQGLHERFFGQPKAFEGTNVLDTSIH